MLVSNEGVAACCAGIGSHYGDASMIRYNFSGRQEVGSQVFVYHCDFPMAELMYV